ncbi:MAG: type IV pilin protein, partial [Bacilli bacterium]
MKRSKKGFTLIEILAVVIILAVVLLIAVPTVLNLIEKTNKEAF